MEIILNDCKWKVQGYWPYVPLLGKGMELGNQFMGVTDWIDATVPGGVHYDLLKSGLIEDPYFECNSLKCEWVENRWWKYKTSFYLQSELKGKKLNLFFKGVDYKAYFYLNGIQLGEHEGMFETVNFDVTGKVNDDNENELEVILENVPWEMSQIGYTSKTKTQKSRFAYKWDFGTRMVNIGIWDDVILKVTGDFTIGDTFISTDVSNGTGIVNISAGIAGKQGEMCNPRITISHEDEIVFKWDETLLCDENLCELKKKIRISDPKLWYPNGIGEQDLYRVKIEIFQNGLLSDEKEYYTGIRKLQYRQNQGSPRDSLPYTIIINGNPIYIKAVNLTPFDHLYGNITKETYEKYIGLIKKANINMVRVWGGGIVEKEYFYHLCDVHGILIWQDFIQSSSGIENIPSMEPDFLKLLQKTVLQAVKIKRNHVCHTVWCGGNELMDENSVPITYEHPNIEIIKNIVNNYDPDKLFLPSTSSGPSFGLNVEQPGKNHDVHGSWKYEGIENHYRMYNRSDSLFHSEFGVDGCSSFTSLKRFLGKENLKVTNMKDNLVWRHHGEWWDTLSRDREIFGEFASLEQFINASQFIQAEGLRYIVETNRRRKFKNSGSIVWQFNEPWPNVSCTSLVEYYGIPKMAYYWLGKAYAPIHASLKYDKLFYTPSEEFKGEIFIHNSLGEQALAVVWEIIDVHGEIVQKEEIKIHFSPNSGLKIRDIIAAIPLLEYGIFFVRLSVYNSSGEKCCQNLYIFSQKEREIFSHLLDLEKGSLQIEKTNDGFKIRNTGKIVCLFIHGIETTGDISVFVDGNYTSLFPGEEKLFSVSPLNATQEKTNTDLSIDWKYFNE